MARVFAAHGCLLCLTTYLAIYTTKGRHMSQKWMLVVQTGSPIRRHRVQKQTLRGLGLKRIGHGAVLKDTPETRGMIRRVRHLVKVLDGPLSGPPTTAMAKDFAVLRRFNRRVSRTEQSGFWKRYADQIPNVISRMENVKIEALGNNQFKIQGTIFSVLEDFDQDQINAFVLDYRQYIQRNDPISLSSLASIFEHPWIHPGARQRFAEGRDKLNNFLARPITLDFGGPRMSMRQLVDIVVYGGLAHSNVKKAAIFEQWEASGVMGFVWAEFFSAMREMMQALMFFRSLNEQLLDVLDPPVKKGDALNGK